MAVCNELSEQLTGASGNCFLYNLVQILFKLIAFLAFLYWNGCNVSYFITPMEDIEQLQLCETFGDVRGRVI